MNAIYNEDDGLLFRIEMWTREGSIDRVIAKSSSIVVARAALESAIGEYPHSKLTLCQRGRLIDGTEVRERARALRSPQ